MLKTIVFAVGLLVVTLPSIALAQNGPGVGFGPGPTPGMAIDGANAAPPTLNNLSKNTSASRYYATAYNGAVSGTACTWDISHDVGDCVNAAIAAAAANGGGVVIGPAGSYGQTVTISPINKVHVEWVGGANYGQCGSLLKWLGSAGGVMVAVGSDASASNVVGAGFSGTCLNGNGLAGTGLKLRSVAWGDFHDQYIYSVTSKLLDIDISSTANAQTAFNHFNHIYLDASDASSVSANGLVIGPGTASNDTNRNFFNDITIIYQATGMICGNADSNHFENMHVEPFSTATAVSLDLLGHASSNARTCRSNRFSGEFGSGNVVSTHVVAEDNTFPSVNNWLFLNHESGAPVPAILGNATLNWQSSQGLLQVTRLSIGGQGGASNFDTGTAWSAYTPSSGCGAGTLTTSSTAGRYKQLGKTVFFEASLTITTNGTCSALVFLGFPTTPLNVGAFAGRETAAVGFGLAASVAAGTSYMALNKYDGTYPGANGYVLQVSGSYESQ